MIAKYSLMKLTNKISQIEYDKIFNIYQKHNKKHHVFNICIKIIDNTIYVYIKDILNNNSELVHTTYTNINKIFIQLSNDYKYLSIPENNDICIYDLSQILTDNILIKKHIITLTNYQIIKCMLFEKYFMFVNPGVLTIINLQNNTINKINTDNINVSLYGNFVVYHTSITHIYDVNNNKTYTTKKNNMIATDDNILFENDNRTFKIYNVIEDKMQVYNNGNICNKYNFVKCKENLYVIYGHKNNLLVYWILQSELSGPYYVNLHISKCEFMDDNGLICIYKTNNLIYMYNFNDIIAVQLSLTRAINIKKQIQCIKSHYRKIIIRGCDDISLEYDLNDYMNTFIETQETKFELQYNINISIYNTTKSFYLFQDLIIDKIHITDIIKNIFTLNNLVSIHNTFTELLNHFYDFTHGIVLKDKSYFDAPKNSQLKILYIGHIILALITQYYITLFAIVDVNNINYDIINTYKDIFPIFVEYIPDILICIKN